MSKLTSEYNTTINCIVTDIGLAKGQEAARNDGWYIYPTLFAVSDEKGILSSNRSQINIPWFQDIITARHIRDSHNIEFVCTIPADASKLRRQISEVYLLADDELGNHFLLAVGQVGDQFAQEGFYFEPNVSVTLNITLNLLNIDTVSIFKVIDTRALEISQHNDDPNAHPDLRDVMASRLGTIVTTQKDEYVANRGDIIGANCLQGSMTIELPAIPDDGDTVTVIDLYQMCNQNNIIVTPSKTRKQTIDLCNANFILDSPGAWVVFRWAGRYQNWSINLGGRNNNLKSSADKTSDLKYSHYFHASGLQLYNSEYDYPLGSVVLGSDFNMYFATNNTGPTYKNISDPTSELQNIWTPFANKKYVQYISQPITKGTPIKTSPFTRGAGQISVYIQGLKCSCGLSPNIDTFYEDVNVRIGTRDDKIFFYDDIPANFNVVIVRE